MKAENTPKLCECGCGQPAPISRYSNTAKGYVRGQPRRFVSGHNGAHRPFTPLERRYTATEAGYDTPCWLWQMSGTPNGYGRTWDPGSGRVVSAHRYFYERFVGPIPPGMQIDHPCRNRACVNPEHLEPVTQETNQRRGANAKLSDSDRAEIACLRKQGWDLRRLGRHYGVSKPTIQQALLYEGRADRRDEERITGPIS